MGVELAADVVFAVKVVLKSGWVSDGGGGGDVMSSWAIEDVWSIVDNMISIAFFARSSDLQLSPWSNSSTNSVFGVDIHVSRSKGWFIHAISRGG